MSDFALRQLKKFGWTEGEGLGKTKSGISEPIKASMKFSRRGLGAAYKPSEKEEHFWSALYDEAIKAVAVKDPVKSDKKSTVSILPNLKYEAEKDSLLKSVEKSTGKTNFRDGDKDQSQESADTCREASPTSAIPMAIKRKATKIAFEHYGTLLDPVSSKTVEVLPKSAHPKHRKRSYSSSCSSSDSEDQGELAKSSGAGTGHPAIRFGSRCSGKLARAAKFI